MRFLQSRLADIVLQGLKNLHSFQEAYRTFLVNIEWLPEPEERVKIRTTTGLKQRS